MVVIALVLESGINKMIVDTIVPAELRRIRIQNDPVIAGLRNTKSVIVNRMVHMEIKDKDQVIPFEYDGLVPIVHV